jgi:3-carboxy-cis,cis-muconate cycloisomerase
VRLSSSRSELFGALQARGGTADATSDHGWLQAMLDFEAALARAQAGAGLIPEEDADAIAAACHAERFDIGEIGAAAAGIGNPAGPLVKALTAAVEGPAAGHVHRGATSQDVLDTAAMLVAQRALEPLLADLAAGAEAAARLAAQYRDTPMAGRTLLQQAVPVTFGLKAAGWMTALDEAGARLAHLRDTRLAVQLGGAAGTLASLGDAGPDVLARLAAELGLAEPVMSWHTLRTRIGELAGALGGAAGSIGKAARDVTLMAQTEVAEVREAASGGSSAMPHKQNPVAAVAALSCAGQAPGLAAALLAAMIQEHERAAGAWHAEWKPFSDLLVATGSAAAWLRASLEGLHVDAARMRSNLDATGGLLLAERVAAALAPAMGGLAAHELVERAAASGRPFAEALDEATELGRAEIDRLLDPEDYLGSAGEFVDRALAAHPTEVPS